MRLELQDRFYKLLIVLRQREGMTDERLRRLTADPKKLESDFRAISEHAFFIRLREKTGADAQKVFFRYVAATLSIVPSPRQETVRMVLNVGENGQKVTNELLEGRRGLAVGVYGAQKDESITVPTFRAKIEEEQLSKVAELLDNPVVEVVEAMDLDPADFPEVVPHDQLSLRPGMVCVIGGAVMDINFVIPDNPAPGGSVQALQFLMHPGGKALTQAVACSRLGLETKIIAVVGDDHNGDQIQKYLQDEGVDTSLVERAEGQISPVTAVMTTLKGHSSAIGWKNDINLPLQPNYINDKKVENAIRQSDFLLSSFEVASEAVEAGLKVANGAGVTTIVTPAPPYEHTILNHSHHGYIDYLVANVWELTEFRRFRTEVDEGGGKSFDEQVRDTAREVLLGSRMKNLVVTYPTGCLVFRRNKNPDDTGPVSETMIPSPEHRFTEIVGERDAFCAMLARKHLGFSRDELTFDDMMKWATAAMGAVGGGPGVPLTMPRFEMVEDVYDAMPN